jgi:hypothetical protein
MTWKIAWANEKSVEIPVFFAYRQFPGVIDIAPLQGGAETPPKF